MIENLNNEFFFGNHLKPPCRQATNSEGQQWKYLPFLEIATRYEYWLARSQPALSIHQALVAPLRFSDFHAVLRFGGGVIFMLG